jgi:hypothetical protein
MGCNQVFYRVFRVNPPVSRVMNFPFFSTRSRIDPPDLAEFQNYAL